MIVNIKKTLSILIGSLVIVCLGCCHKDVYLRQRVKETLTPYNSILTNGRNIYPSTIRLIDKQYGFECTAFVIDGQYALTAAHCLVDEDGNLSKETMTISDLNDNATGVFALPVAIDQYQDVGLIKGNFKDFNTAKVDFSGKVVKQGMHLKSCGFAAGQKELFCVDLIQVGNQGFEYATVGPPIFKGCSGGSVIEVNSGLIIGVNSAVSEHLIVIGPVVGILQTFGIE
jgi:hypothetical protein